MSPRTPQIIKSDLNMKISKVKYKMVYIKTIMLIILIAEDILKQQKAVSVFELMQL